MKWEMSYIAGKLIDILVAQLCLFNSRDSEKVNNDLCKTGTQVTVVPIAAVISRHLRSAN